MIYSITNTLTGPLPHPQLMKMLSLVPKLFEQFGAECASSLVLSTAGQGLKPHSKYLKQQLWNKSTRVWWNGNGAFSYFPRDILSLIKQKTILLPEDNHIYFDNLVPLYFSQAEPIFSRSLGVRRGLIWLIYCVGSSSSKYTEPLLSQCFPPDPELGIFDFCTVQENPMDNCVDMLQILDITFSGLNEDLKSIPFQCHPLVRQYAPETLTFISKVTQFYQDTFPDELLYGVFEKALSVLETLANAGVLTQVTLVCDFLTYCLDVQDVNDIESLQEPVLCAAAPIFESWLHLHNQIPKESQACLSLLVQVAVSQISGFCQQPRNDHFICTADPSCRFLTTISNQCSEIIKNHLSKMTIREMINEIPLLWTFEMKDNMSPMSLVQLFQKWLEIFEIGEDDDLSRTLQAKTPQETSKSVFTLN